MSNLLETISQQAREFATTRHPITNISLNFDNDKFEHKFYELVVLECMDAVKNTDTKHAYTTWDRDQALATIEKAGKSIAQKMSI